MTIFTLGTMGARAADQQNHSLASRSFFQSLSTRFAPPLLVLAFLSVQGTAQRNVPLPTNPSDNMTPPIMRLAPQDVIDLEVFDTPELSNKSIRISQDGNVHLPVAGDIHVAGLTPLEADDAIAILLRQREIMLDPRVTILVTEYATEGVSVLGEVNKPGTYLLLGSHSLYDALSQAGGITQREGSTIVLTHQSNPTQAVTIPVDSPNYSEQQRLTFIEPGDVIVVSRADTIFVIGDVAHPGEFPVPSGKRYTTLDAVALAAGTNHTAKVEKASIVRNTAAGVVTLRVDLKKIAENRELDPGLQAGDVLVVPRSGFRSFLDYALPNATGALAGAVGAAIIYR